MGENDETGVTEGISQHPASQEGANVAGSGALSLGAALVFFNAPYFKRRVLKRAATTPAANGSSWTTARSIASTAPERRCWKRYRKTDFRARVIWLGFQPPNRGSHLAETLWSTDGTRRRCPLPHPQISRGCLRIRRLCRNIGSRSRAVVGCVGSLVRRSLSARSWSWMYGRILPH
jgi:hypothetical protein